MSQTFLGKTATSPFGGVKAGVELDFNRAESFFIKVYLQGREIHY